MSVRMPAVAGLFYPGSVEEIEAGLDQAFAQAAEPAGPAGRPKALVVPHAGWIYSGPVAASAYRLVPDRIARVVLLGPSHFVAFRGLAVPEADAFQTPCGDIEVDQDARAAAAGVPGVVLSDRPHQREHSLEVQLPFLQRAIPGGFSLLPVAVGSAEPVEVAALLGSVWGGSETLVIISTDLSHYLTYDQARRRDRRTADAVLALDPDSIADDDACGSRGLRGLLVAARFQGIAPALLDLRSSGDTAGDPSRVVGYGAFAFA